jgi:hypothetical protein
MPFWILIFLTTLAWPSDSPKERCQKEAATTAAPRFPVVQPIETMQSQYDQLYASETRLNGHIYWEEKEKTDLAAYNGKTAKIPWTFIASVTKHLKIALERGYANFLFYSDMGHGHLIYSKERWGSLGKEENSTQVLENLLNANSEKILYHTAELLQLRAGKNFDGEIPTDP